MPHIADFTYRDVLALQDEIRSSLLDCNTLQQAAQRVTDHLWEAFASSAVLIRCFVTIPYHRLPAPDQDFARHLAETKDVSGELRDETLILSLLGTRGIEAGWNDRETSEGHRGIPLLSANFIDAIPMVARLLREIGVEPGWFEAEDSGGVEMRLVAGQVGVFHVRDAAVATDSQGRLIISAQNFVQEHAVKTVFGLGGSYGDGTILTLLIFTREQLDKEAIAAFTHLIVLVKAATADLLRHGALFASAP